MKRCSLLVGFLALVAISSASCAVAGSTTRGIRWDHNSMITVVETISALGDGTYNYSYGFTNTETTGIWTFSLFTTFGVSNITPFQGSPWLAGALSMDKVQPCYDGRNLNPALAYNVSTWPKGWGYPSQVIPIDVGQTVTGFSFTSTVYDPTSKPFYYELVGTYAGDSGPGIVSALGYTSVPEPSSILLLLSGVAGLGGMALRRRK